MAIDVHKSCEGTQARYNNPEKGDRPLCTDYGWGGVLAASTTILVASHKPYWMPSDPLYLPVQVGAAQHDHIEGFAHDDEGDNISSKNPRYCELTALWWGWRNLSCDWLGLVHYRRHFAGSGERGFLSSADAERLVSNGDVVVAKARNYYIETIESHYMHTFDQDGSQLAALRKGVHDVSPARVATLEEHLAQRKGHMFNMLIMPRDVLDAYCTWLFDVLEATESYLDFSQMNDFHARCVGRLGERCLDVWLKSEGVPVQEVRVKNPEKTNWVKKGGDFLAAKFFGKRYESSF